MHLIFQLITQLTIQIYISFINRNTIRQYKLRSHCPMDFLHRLFNTGQVHHSKNQQKQEKNIQKIDHVILPSTKTLQLQDKQNPDKTDQFESNTSFLLRYTLFGHCFKLILRIKNSAEKLINYDPDQNKIFKSQTKDKVQLKNITNLQSNNRLQMRDSINRSVAHHKSINLKDFPNLQKQDESLFIVNLLILFLTLRLNSNQQQKLNKNQTQKLKSLSQLQQKIHIRIKKLKSNFQLIDNQDLEQKIFSYDQINWKDLLFAIFKIKQFQMNLVFFFAFIEVFVARFTIHILVPYFLTAVFQQNMRTCYIYGIIIGFLYCVYMYFYGLEKYMITKVSNGFRYGLIFLMVKKILKLPQYTLKKAQLGKMLNLLSNDLNIVQQKLQYLGKLIADPIYFVATFTLLIVRYDWAGVASIAVVLIVGGIQVYISTLINKKLIQINTQKDNRIHFISQIIEGIKFIKIYAWQNALKKIIDKIRQKQLNAYFGLALLRGIETGLAFTLGCIAGLVLIIVYYLLHREELNSIIIFSMIQIFMFFRPQMITFTFALTSLSEIILTLQRYSTILNVKSERMIQIQSDNEQTNNFSQNVNLNLNPKQNFSIQFNPTQIIIKKNKFQSNKKYTQNSNSNSEGFFHSIQDYSPQINNIPLNQKNTVSPIIEYQNCSIGWNRDKFCIQNINWKVQKPSYIGIAGKIGSGKSTLLYSLLQEIPYYKGKLQVSGKIAYVEQQPILFSMSIRDNILFQKPYDANLYEKIINNSNLAADLKNFPLKDQTIVGQKGITLSGGQKSRLALARALYVNPDILILDDPFSAVDPSVGLSIFNNCIQNQRKNRTIILATHHIQYFQQCDYILFLQKRKIVAKDTFNNLQQKLKSLNKSISEQKGLMKLDIKKQIERKISLNNQAVQKSSELNQQSYEVKIRSYFQYFLSSKKNYIFAPMMLILFFGSEVVNTFAYRFLANYDNHRQGKYYLFNRNDLQYWLSISGLFVLYFILNVIKFYLIYLCALFSNKQIHELMIYKLIRTPMKYFDQTPSGDIISRFSNDLGVLDYSLAFAFVGYFAGLAITIVMSINVFQVNIIYIVPSLASAVSICLIYKFIKKPLQKSHQLDLMQKSPLFTNISETIMGMIQFKYYTTKKSTLNIFNRQIDNSSRVNYAYWLISKAFDIYGYYLSGLSFYAIILIGLSSITKQNAGQYAMIFVFMIQVNDFIIYFFKQLSMMENFMISYERSQAQFFTQYDKQKNYLLDNREDKIQKNPIVTCHIQKLFKNCKIQLQNLSMKYRQDLPLTIKNLNVSIKKKQKIGIVGRTGAGKSSVIQVLLRLTEPQEGSVYKINDQNALKLGLHTLRKNISVIPQKTFFFNGTLRKNLDPFDKYTNQEIWQALQHSDLKRCVQSLEKEFDTNITLIQNTFSMGQRQLLSLSRVLLRKNNILILDEATSSVDSQTDQFIQRKIKQNFSDATIFTIAHRLSTIADYDKIIVIYKGEIKQFDHPYNLLKNKGEFWDMVQNSGSQRDKIIQLATKSYQKSYK